MTKISTRMAGFILAFGLFFGCQRISNNTNSIQVTKLNLNHEDYSQALSSVKNSISQNPNNPEAYYYKGFILEKMAIEQTDVAARKHLYSKMRDAFMQAKNLYHSQSKTSAPDYQNIDKILIKSWNKENNRGISLFKSDSSRSINNLKIALAHLDNANVIEPDSGITYEEKADVYYKMGELSHAISTMETAVSLDNNEYTERDITKLAFLYLENGQYEHAIETYKEALQNAPGDVNILRGLANAYLSNGEHQEAANLLNTLLSNDMNNQNYLLAYGTQLFALSQGYFEELYHIRKNIYNKEERKNLDASSLKALKDSSDTIQNKARSYFEKAEKNLLKAHSIDSTDTSVNYALGTMYQNTGIEYFKIMNVTQRRKLAELYDGTVHNLFKKALPYLQRVKDKEPDNSKVLKSLYNIYNFLDMKSKAQRIQNQLNT